MRQVRRGGGSASSAAVRIAAAGGGAEDRPRVKRAASPSPSLLERVASERSHRTSPAERAEVLAEMCEKYSYKDVALRVNMSPSHVRNFVRLKRSLAPDVWESFKKLGPDASIRQWLLLCAMDAKKQRVAAKGLVKAAPPGSADLRKKSA